MPALVKSNKEAKDEWLRLGPQLSTAGLMSEVYLATFAMYCLAWSQMLKARRQLDAKKPLQGMDPTVGYVVMARSGYLMPSPWVAIESKAAERLRQLAGELGLSPASTGRVDRVQQPDLFGGDPFDEFMGGR